MATQAKAFISAKPLTLISLKRRIKVTESHLIKEITPDDHLLAGCFDGYEVYMSKLELTLNEQRDVQAFASQYDSQSAMRKALTLWFRRNPPAATYKALVKIALTLGEGETAINICKYLKSKGRRRHNVAKPTTCTIGTETTEDMFETDCEDDMTDEQDTCTTDSDFCEPFMGEHSSYHGAIRGQEAQYRLRAFKTRCYLTRYSRATRSYRLSIYEPDPIRNRIQPRIKHFKITINKQPYICGIKQKVIYKMSGREFENPKEMFCYFEKNRIDPVFRDIGRCITEREYFEFTKTKNNNSNSPNEDMDKIYDDKLKRIAEKEQWIKEKKDSTCITS